MTTWLPRIAVVLVFLSIGLSKFRDPMWVRTGIMQISGAVLVLIPRTVLAGIALTACTMLGASIVWLTVLHAPQNAPIPAFELRGVTGVPEPATLTLTALGLVGTARRHRRRGASR